MDYRKTLLRFILCSLTGIVAFVTSCSPSSLSGDKTDQQSSDIPNNVILYKSATGTIIIPSRIDAFGAKIISNTYEEGVGKLVFDADLTEIGAFAFAECDELVSITLPNSITTMGTLVHSIAEYNSWGEVYQEEVNEYYGAIFKNCKHLTTVTLPSSLTYLANNMFEKCPLLSNVQLPKGLTTIGNEAFLRCGELRSITIPSSVTYIGNYAFDVTGIESISLPNSLSYLGRDAFTQMTTFTLPKSLTHVRNFSYALGWDSITIPEHITHVNSRCFRYGEDTPIVWASITIKAKEPPKIVGWTCHSWEWAEKGESARTYTEIEEDEMGLFYYDFSAPEGCSIYVPAASVQAYKQALGWRQYADIIKPIP